VRMEAALAVVFLLQVSGCRVHKIGGGGQPRDYLKGGFAPGGGIAQGGGGGG